MPCRLPWSQPNAAPAAQIVHERCDAACASTIGAGRALLHAHRTAPADDPSKPVWAECGARLGSPLPRLHRDWAHPCHGCTGTGLHALGSLLTEWARARRHACAKPAGVCVSARTVTRVGLRARIRCGAWDGLRGYRLGPTISRGGPVPLCTDSLARRMSLHDTAGPADRAANAGDNARGCFRTSVWLQT